jgi:hypothetical protein
MKAIPMRMTRHLDPSRSKLRHFIYLEETASLRRKRCNASVVFDCGNRYRRAGERGLFEATVQQGTAVFQSAEISLELDCSFSNGDGQRIFTQIRGLSRQEIGQL